MENMLKDFERVLNRKVGSVKELELILTTIYNNKLEEVDENRAKAFEELGEPLRKLCGKYNVIIQIPGLYDWNVEPIEGYDYSKVCEKLNAEDVKSAIKIIDYKIQEYMDKHFCSNVYAFDRVCEELFKDEKPFILDSDYEQPFIKIDYEEPTKHNLTQKLEDAEMVIIITTACQIQILKTKYLLRHSEHSLELFDKINNLSDIKAIYGVFKVYGEKGGSHENIECIYGEDNLIGYADNGSINPVFDILQ